MALLLGKLLVDGLYRLKQVDRVLLKVVEVPRVGDVLRIRFEHFILAHLVGVGVLLLFLAVEQLARGERPGEQVASLVERREESILLAPDEILIFLPHANQIDRIEVREGNDRDAVKVLDEREAIAEFASIEEVVHASNGRCQFVLFDLALEKLRKVVDVKSAGLVPAIRFKGGAARVTTFSRGQ